MVKLSHIKYIELFFCFYGLDHLQWDCVAFYLFDAGGWNWSVKMNSWLATGGIKRKDRQDIDDESTPKLPAVKQKKGQRNYGAGIVLERYIGWIVESNEAWSHVNCAVTLRQNMNSTLPSYWIAFSEQAQGISKQKWCVSSNQFSPLCVILNLKKVL